jgi:hypothetical protein
MKKCEWCERPHDGSYGSGRFCRMLCMQRYNIYTFRHKKCGKRRVRPIGKPGTCEWCGALHYSETCTGRFCNRKCACAYMRSFRFKLRPQWKKRTQFVSTPYEIPDSIKQKMRERGYRVPEVKQ